MGIERTGSSDPNHWAYHTDECEATKAREDGMQNWPRACNCKGRQGSSKKRSMIAIMALSETVGRVAREQKSYRTETIKDLTEAAAFLAELADGMKSLSDETMTELEALRAENANLRANYMRLMGGAALETRAGVSFEEHDRYKRCLYRANGRLIQAGHEPEKLNYADQAAADVLTERQRQVTAEGWSPDHDDEHSDGALARAAACYAVGIKHLSMPVENTQYDTGVWPFDAEWWKPKDPRRNLVRAAALILAEIERLDRHSQKASEHCRTGDYPCRIATETTDRMTKGRCIYCGLPESEPEV